MTEAVQRRVSAVKQVASGVDRKVEVALGSHVSMKGTPAVYYTLGAPIAADTDYIVASADMKVGSYTIAHQPDVPRVVTCTRTAGGTADTPGTITVTGTNAHGDVITDILTPGDNGVLVTGTKAFKTVTSVVGAGWVIDGTEGTKDTIIVGVGAAIGLPIAITATAQVVAANLGTAWASPSASASSLGEIEKSLITLSTWDGSKVGGVFITQ